MKIYITNTQFNTLQEQFRQPKKSSDSKEIKQWCKANFDKIVDDEFEIKGEKWSINSIIEKGKELSPTVFKDIKVDASLVDDYWQWPSLLKYILPIPSFKPICTHAYRINKNISKVN